MFLGKIQVYVGAIHQETEAIKRFELYPFTNEPLPVFSGGSHITTYLQMGEGICERNYSLVSHPSLVRDHYEIAVRRNEQSKGGSKYWHDEVNVGQQLEISLPKNHFPLSFQAKHHVFYAAGIGITPFLTMMADLKAEGKTFELHYAAQTKEKCAFYHLLNELYPEECTFYFSKEEQPTKLFPEHMQGHFIGTHVYFCGPDSMVQQFAQSAEAYGYPEKSIHYELFTPPNFGEEHAFEVRLASSNQVLTVQVGENLLDRLLECGVDAKYSCKVGGCGSCELDVLKGEVDHRDMFYNEDERRERRVILPCVSRAKDHPLLLNI